MARRKTLLAVIEEFAHQHRGRNHAVVPDALADVTDVEKLPGREQRFEKQIPVLIPKRAVSRLRVLGDKVKAHGTLLPRICIIVHADESHNPKGDAPHRQHLAKSDTAREESFGKLHIFKLRQKIVSHYLNLHRVFESRKLLKAFQLFELSPQQLRVSGRIIVFRDEG